MQGSQIEDARLDLAPMSQPQLPALQHQKQTGKTEWIESLYHKPIDDCRYYCIWRIFVPYFINNRMLSQSETFNLIKNWLDRCSLIKRLSFNARNSINHALRTVRHFLPISLFDLKVERPILYAQLMR